MQTLDPLLERYIRAIFPMGKDFMVTQAFIISKVVNIIHKQVKNHRRLTEGHRRARFGFDPEIKVTLTDGRPTILLLTFVHMVKRVSIFERPPADFVIGVMKEMLEMGYSLEIQEKKEGVYLQVTLPLNLFESSRK